VHFAVFGAADLAALSFHPKQELPVFIININANGRGIATVELPCYLPKDVANAFVLFQEKFPAPDYALALVKHETTAECLAKSDNW